MGNREGAAVGLGLVAIVAALVLLKACADDLREPEPSPIAEVIVAPDGRQLVVRIGGDGVAGAVSVEESDFEVRLSGSSVSECPPNALCMGLLVPAQLEQLLGDRRLIDDVTGAPVQEIVRCDRGEDLEEPSAGLESCQSADSPPGDSDASDASAGLVLTDITTDTSAAALARGTLELRNGCVILDSGRYLRLTVWPTGTTLDTASQPPIVQLPDSGPVPIDGVQREYGGGSAAIESYPAAADCAEEFNLDEVWLMSPRAEVSGVQG